ncbi:MAG: zinc ribbon domain-containing protein [Gemmatimonadaceae bacterium]
MTPLIVGTVLAFGALAYVLYPLFFGVTRRPAARIAPAGAGDRDGAVTALREIEFDRATGKLSGADYDDLKARYTAEAIMAMRRDAAPGGAEVDDEIEAALRAYRATHKSCPECGPRPETDAAFCSNCGRYLHDRCAGCGAPVDARDARYCVNCGDQLLAS